MKRQPQPRMDTNGHEYEDGGPRKRHRLPLNAVRVARYPAPASASRCSLVGSLPIKFVSIRAHSWLKDFGVIFSLAWSLSPADAASVQPSWEHPPHQQQQGVFWREHWYERGLTNANPAYERRFRINSPEASLHPSFGQRVEARENGLMLIRAEEDLFQITGAELYAELWGGHPGTANKRVTVNGRATYQLPRIGTEEGHCTYQYPVIPLARADLVNGHNAFQWALDQGTTFWGHALIDNACLRVALTNGHPDLVKLGLADFAAPVVADSVGRGSRQANAS